MKRTPVRPPPWGQPESWRLCGQPRWTTHEPGTSHVWPGPQSPCAEGGWEEEQRPRQDEARAVWSLAWGLDGCLAIVNTCELFHNQLVHRPQPQGEPAWPRGEQDTVAPRCHYRPGDEKELVDWKPPQGEETPGGLPAMTETPVSTWGEMGTGRSLPAEEGREGAAGGSVD